MAGSFGCDDRAASDNGRQAAVYFLSATAALQVGRRRLFDVAFAKIGMIDGF
jgi:hypothetical protein